MHRYDITDLQACVGLSLEEFPVHVWEVEVFPVQ